MKKLLCVLMFGMMFGQSELTTRVYSFDIDNQELILDINELTGENITFGWVEIVDITVHSIDCIGDDKCTFYIEIYPDNFSPYSQSIEIWEDDTQPILINSNKLRIGNFISNSIMTKNIPQVMNLYAELKLAVTAEFPEEDTGYMEEGFDYCLHTGANLVSSPCRDEVAISDAIPSEIANNLQGIITEGGASTNLNGTWVGSLNGLGGGKGYWFVSNMEGCFNYTCAEN